MFFCIFINLLFLQYIVTDKTGIIGTSNWSADYFISTGGIGFVFAGPLRADLVALFNRAEFNIDPTESNFKKTKNMEKIIGEKQKRITSGLVSDEKNLVTSKKQRLDPELSQALKSVKNKWNKNAKKNKKLKFTVKDK